MMFEAVRQAEKVSFDTLRVSTFGINALETVTAGSGRVEMYEALYIRCTSLWVCK
jgi:hypothetical protein